VTRQAAVSATKPVERVGRLGRWARMGRYWLTLGSHHLPPNRSRSLFVLGHPRTGTNWCCRIMSQYFGLPIYQVGERAWPDFRPAVLHLHRFAVVPQRTVYMIRDGRDVAVSFYHKAANSLPRRNPAVFARLQSFCPREATHDNVRENLPGFIRFLFEANRSSTIPYDAHVRLARQRGLFTIRYEDLQRKGPETVARVVEHLQGAPADPERVRETLEATSFERRTGRQRGQEDLSAGRSLRKGIIGDWANVFTREAGEVFDAYAGEVLVELGYEPDRSWVGKLAD